MVSYDPLARLRDIGTYPLTRRQALKWTGLALGLASLPALLAACGGETPTAAPAAAPAPTTAKPTAPPPPPTTAPAPTTAPTKASTAAPASAPTKAPAAATVPGSPAPATAATGAARVATVNVVAKDFVFEIDKLVVPAGNVHFTFKNSGKMTHDFWVYPPQDLTPYLAKKRAGEKVKGRDYLKGASELFDLEAGKSGEKDYVLQPGYYELACFVQAKDPDGATFVHVDKGQTQWLTVTGPGFPPAATTPANTIAVKMEPGTGDFANSWRFVPDKLVVPAGDVTFKVTNGMKEEHDFVVHPLGDITTLVTFKLKGPGKGFDYGTIKGAELLEDLPAGKTDSKTMKLTPGPWVAACYILGKNPDGTPFLHSDRGQRFVFMVK